MVIEFLRLYFFEFVLFSYIYYLSIYIWMDRFYGCRLGLLIGSGKRSFDFGIEVRRVVLEISFKF